MLPTTDNSFSPTPPATPATVAPRPATATKPPVARVVPSTAAQISSPPKTPVLTTPSPPSSKPAGPSQCGTVTSAINTPIRVTVSRGATSCSAARAIAQTYYQEIPTQGQGGNGAYLTVNGWNCNSVPIGETEQDHHTADCTRGTDAISLDVPQ